MGRSKLETLSDYSRRGYDVRVLCIACEHMRVFDATILAMEIHRRKGSTRIDDLEHKLRCSSCGSNDVHITAVEINF